MVTTHLTGFQLSPQQESVWRSQGSRPAIGFVCQGLLEWRGPLDRRRLRVALDHLVERHEILRTSIRRLPGMKLPIQVVEDRGTVLWSETEASGPGDSVRERLVAESRRSPTLRADDAPLQASLISLGETRHDLLLTLPGYAADARSLRILAQEIAALYAGETELPSVLQYADAAENLLEWLGPEDGPGAVFWRQQSPPSREPADAAEPRAPETERRRLSSDRVAKLAEQTKVSVPLLLLAAWSAALWWETGEEPRTLAVAHDGRTLDALTRAVGPYARYLPLKSEAGPAIALDALARRLEGAFSTAAAWQEALSVDRLEMEPGGPDSVPFWPSAFDSDRREVISPSVSFRPVFAGLGRFGLRLSVVEDDEAIDLDLHYDPSRHDRGLAAHLLDRLERVLDGAALRNGPIGEMDVLTEGERRALLADFNATEVPYPTEAVVTDLFEARVRLAPLAPAVDSPGRAPLTFGELDEQANRLARRLRELGIGPEARVGILLEREPEMVVALLAVLKAGGAYVPLDPAHPAERLRFLLEDAGLAALVTRERLLPSEARGIGASLVDLDDSAALPERGEGPPPRLAEAANAAYVIYTSGSTGRPKGVVVTHRGLVNYISWARIAYAAGLEKGAPVHSSLGFDLTVTSLFVPLLAGAPITMVPEDGGVEGLAATLRRERFGLVKITPAHLGSLRRLTPEGEDLPSGDCLVVGGDALRTADIGPWIERGARIFNEYGPTETVVGCCVHPVGPEGRGTDAVPIGRPIANTRLYVMSPGLRPMPAGAPGELWIGGDGVARGYQGRPDLTAERFVPDPFAPPDRAGSRLYRSGDLVRLSCPELGLEYLGRIDDQVKIRGHRIEPGEVAAVLAGHPGLRDAAVAPRGEGDDRRLIAWVVPLNRAKRPSASMLRAFLVERLPAPMIPAAFVPLDILPLTANGKLDRRALPDPNPGGDQETAYAPPRTATETTLAEVWAQVLGVDRVGIDDPFFSLGGDSIRSLQILALAQKRGLAVSTQDLFQRPTIRGLAERVRSADGGEKEPAASAPFSLATPADRVRLPEDVEDAYPLARLQAGMLFHGELDPGSAVYHDQHSFHVRARFSLELMRETVDRISLRHPLLRTSFDFATYGEPLQLVHRAIRIPIEVRDLRHVPAAEQDEAISEWLREERLSPFDWTRPPLVRLHVHLKDESSFQLTLSFHHAVLDGWSSASLLTDLLQSYALLLRGEALPADAPLAVTYRDFVALETAAAASEEARTFWRRMLDGAEPTRLPAPTAPKSAKAQSGIREIHTRIDPTLSDEVKRIARESRVPLKSLLLAAHMKTLRFLGGTRDVLTGLISHGRPDHADGERILGLFLNTLPVRMHLLGGTWLDLAREVFALESRMLPFRHFPLAELRDLEQGLPKLENAFNYLHYHVYKEAAEVREIEVVGYHGYEETNVALITHAILDPFSQDLQLGIAYRGADLDAAEAERFSACLLRTLLAIAEDPTSRYDATVPLSGHEIAQILEGPEATSEPPPFVAIHRRFEQQAALAPDVTALVWDGRKTSYGDLASAVHRIARRLVDLGVGPEVRVAVCAARSWRLVAALLAVWKAGGAYVPLDPVYPRERLDFMLRDADPAVLLIEENLMEILPAAISPGVVLLDGSDEEPAHVKDDPVVSGEPAELPASLAYLIYTSGSTGKPKGVAITHGAAAAFVSWAERAFPPEDLAEVIATTSVCFDLSIFELFVPLSGGGTVVLVDDALALSLPRPAQDAAGATLLNTVPSAAAELERLGALPEGLRTVNLAGEALPRTLVDRLYARGLASVYNLYGPSEDTTYSTFARVPSGDSRPPAIGRAILGGRALLLDAWLLPTPPGVAGEIFLGGAGLARGYLGRPDLTATRFLPDPWSRRPGERLYRTGDLARLRAEDGELEFLGRVDHQVKIRGFRIEPGEIEAALAGLPGVRKAVVLVREDAPGTPMLVAYFVGEAEADALRRSLRERLPDFMVPAAFVRLADLPRTPSGKLDRRALPPPGWQAVETPAAAPKTPVEEIVAGIWADVLGLPRIGAADHFFDLGGHSLLATRVVSRLRGVFGIEMPLRDLFEAPRLGQLAARIEAARRTGTAQRTPPLVIRSRQGPLPLSFAQKRLWLIDQLDPASSLYNMPVALGVEGPLLPRALALCLGEIARRHESLRTTFDASAGTPEQRIQPATPFLLPLVDLGGLPESRREELAFRLAREEAGRPFDLRRGPLLRGLLLRLAASDHVVALTMHHIASDAWSLGILVREVASLYPAYCEGRPSDLPDPPVQYADFSAWQASWLQGEILEGEIAYWRRRLANLPPLLELPADRPRPSVQGFRGNSLPVRLPTGLVDRAKVLCRQEGTTLFMLLLAGFQALLARYSGQDDLAVGTPIAGRNRIEIEDLIGFFVNTLVLRGDLSGRPSFRTLLGRARETTLDAHLHQDLPFEKLVEELAPERSLDHTPLFQAMLALQNAPAGKLEIRDLRLRAIAAAAPSSRFDLTLNLVEYDGELGGALEYATDLFDRATIARLGGHFLRLLDAAVGSVEQPVADLPPLTGAERQQLETEWNDTAPRTVPGVVERFERIAAQLPESVAVVVAGDEASALNYRDLDRRADLLARRLRALGVGPEVAVGLCVGQAPELAVGVLGIAKSGGVLLALDLAQPAERLRFLLEDASVKALVTLPRLLPSLPRNVAEIVLLGEEEAAEPGSPRGLRGGRPEPGDLAYLIYTSGTTGRPKAVEVEHGSLAATLAATQEMFGFSPNDRMPCLALSTFDISLFELLSPLLSGGTAVLFPLRPTLEVEALVDRLGELTCLHAVPALMRGIVAALRRRGPEAPDVRGIRAVFTGGDAVPADLLEDLREAFPAARIWVLYGPTEGTILCSAFPVPPPPAPARPLLGRPLRGSVLHICDAEGRLLPLGVAGELWIGGAGVARGYLSRPDLTSEKFVLRDGLRFYRSGDRTRRLADGALEFLGRLDHQIKIRGFRVEPEEIEAALADLSGVREAAVVAREEDAVGMPGDRRLVAYVAGDASDLTADRLRAELRKRLPDYMVPATYVILEALPLTAHGKVDRKALPDPEVPAAPQGSAAPSDPVEEILAGIWAEVLRRPHVGMRDDFFALGGHSLLATQAVSRLRDALGVELPLRRLFEAPTVAELARVVRAEMGNPPPEPIVTAPREGEIALSFAQQRLWLIDRLEPGNPAYNVPFALKLTGALPTGLLRRVFAEVVRRHEVLRTRFPAERPVQVVTPTGPPPRLPVIDLANLDPAARRDTAFLLAREEARQPFDLEDDPLLRLRLIRLGEDDHVLLLAMHHIVSDAWSVKVLLREIAALFPAFSQGLASPLPELPLQYADFAVWQRGWLTGEVLASQVGFWKERLAGAPQLLALPSDRPRPPVPSFRGAMRRRTFSPASAEALHRLCRQEGSTPFMALLALWALLLGRLGDQDDLLVGFPMAGRDRREVEDLIGFFVNTLVLRCDLAGNPTFRELLRRVKRTTFDAFTHQHLPFDRIVEEVAAQRDRAAPPLIQTMLTFEVAPRTEPEQLDGLSISQVEVDPGSAKLDLTLALAESPAGLAANLEFNTDLYDGGTGERLIDRFAALLVEATADPGRLLADLPLLLAAERLQLAAWSATERESPIGDCIHRLFERQAARTPEATALVAPERQMTYAELNAEANRLAWHLRTLGAGPEIRIALLLGHSADFVISLLAVLKTGAAYLPLDPGYPGQRLADLLSDSAASVLVTHGELDRALPPSRIRIVRLDEHRGTIAALSAEEVPGADEPASLAYVIFTSGSTGRPKGVMVAHDGLCNLAHAQIRRFGVEAGDRVLQFASPGFDASVSEIWMALLAGAELHLADGWRLLPGPDLIALLRDRRVTHLTLSPSVLAALPIGELPDLAVLVLAGEACPRDLARLWSRSGRRLFNAYGPTEGTVCATIARLDVEEGALVPIGGPIAGARAVLLDRHLSPVPLGTPGEICLGGAGLARGYLDLPGLTAERFRPAASDGQADAPGERLYHTGDLGRWRPDGQLEFLGRVDHQIKLRGFRIEPDEIRAALLAHPGVREASVIPRKDAPGPRLVAYVVAAEGAVVAAADLAGFLRARLPEHLIPAGFVLLDELPLTPHGKLDRSALPAPGATVDSGAIYAAPRTPEEEILAGIWADLLGLDRVGVDDDFFALGGHSLLATQVISRLRETLGLEVPLRRLFEAPTVASFTRAVHEAGTGSPMAPPLVPVDRAAGSAFPLSFAQRRLWVLDQIEPGNATYNIPLALRLGGDLSRHRMERVFAEIVRRHEILRTTFASSEGEPRQEIDAEVRCRLPLLDLSGLPAAERAARARSLAFAEAHRSFDLRRGPLLRLQLLRLAQREHLLLLTLHHIVADAWSLNVLLGEVESLHRAYAEGLPSPLPELPLQYADYALWQRSWLQGEVLDAQLAAWKQRLAGAPRVLELPTDRPRPAVRTWRGKALPVELAPSLSAALRDLCRRSGATPYMTLLASWALLLGRHAGQQDVLIGSPVANRNRREIEDLIGFFVNTLVLRVEMADAPSFESLLGRVRQTALEAYTHQDLSFERIVEEMTVERDLAVSPLFQVTFLLQNTPQRRQEPSDLTLEPLAVETGLTKFDLTLALAEGTSGFSGSLEYSTDLLDGATPRRWLRAWKALLEGIVADPARKSAELPLLGAGERAQLLVEWNDTRTTGAAPESVVERFAAQAASTPAATALVWRPADGASASLTFRELDRAANGLAHRLISAGVRPETRVALVAERSPELVIGLLGILKAGGAYVPLDPAYPEERLRFLLADSGASLLVAPPHLVERLPVSGLPVALLGPLGGEPSDPSPEHRPRPGDLAYMIYTSGTAGAPKAVLVEHGSLGHTLRAARIAFDFGPADRMPCVAPFSFDIFLFELLGPLLSGGTSILVDLRPVPDVDRLAEELEEATLIHAVPALMRQIVEAVERRGGPAERYPRLRGIFVGGDAVPPDLLAGLRRAFPRAQTWVLYGPTESTIICTRHAVATGSDHAWIGRPLADVAIRLSDPQGHPVPIGVAGEILIGGPGVARGYWKRDELTAERFLTVEGERFFRTGDVARFLPDGELIFLGRVDSQVKVRGFRVEPGEVEAALLRLPEVRECAVLAREGAQGDRRLVAYVVLRNGLDDGEEPMEARLRGELRRILPEWMIPSLYVALDSLPLSAHGKVDRAALPEPNSDRRREGESFATPRGAVEETLAAIWAEVLGVERVGLHDNFFTLGGDSILSIQVAARAQRAGLGVTSRLVFLHQTVAQLAAAARELGVRSDFGPEVGPMPLTPIQRRFFAGEPVDPHHFNQALLLEETRRLQPARLAAALRLVGSHHDALWLRFRRGPEGWEQEGSLPAADLSLAVVDLSVLPPTLRGSALEAAAASVQSSLDLRRGPLQRAVLFACGEDAPNRFLWVIHHLAVDGVSWRILLGDLAAAYEDLEAGRSPLLPARTASFKRWAERLVEEAGSSESISEISYWLEQRSPEVPLLPGERTSLAAGNTLASQRSASLQLDPEETRALIQEVPKAHGTRINDVLLSALALAFREWAGSPLLLVDLEGHGREDLFPDLDLTRTVGWFTSVHPVLLDLRGTEGAGGALRQVKDQLRRIPRGGIGYGLLEGSATGARFAGRPEAEVSFNYLGQLDQVFSGDFPFRPARESAGRERSLGARRSHLFEIQGSILNGRLSLSCLYSENFHRSAEIEQLVALLGRSLRALIDHCRAPEAVELSPSDFPLAGLTQAQLDGILKKSRPR